MLLLYQIQRKLKIKKKGSGSRPSLAGSGRRTRIRATLTRIFFRIRTRICFYGSQSLCGLRAFIADKICCSGVKEEGDLAFNQIWVKNRCYRWHVAFRISSNFFHEERGDRRPQFAVWRGGSPQKIHTTSQLFYQTLRSSWVLPITFLQLRQFERAITYVKSFDGAKIFDGFSCGTSLLVWAKIEEGWVWTRTLSSSNWSCRSKTWVTTRRETAWRSFAVCRAYTKF